MILTPGIILALILGLALLAHSSAPRGVLALAVIAYFLTPVVRVFSTLRAGEPTSQDPGLPPSLNTVEWV